LPLIKNLKIENKNSTSYQLLVTSVLAAYIAYLIQDFFGFSVVITALFFFLFPAFAFLADSEIKYWTISKKSLIYSLINNNLLSKQINVTIACSLTAILMVFNLYTLVKFWRADTFYKLGQDYSSANPKRAFNLFLDAVTFNPGEPLYHIELGGAAASSAIEYADQQQALSTKLKDKAVSETQTALDIGPSNTSLWRTAILNYYTLSLTDPQYEQKTMDTFDKTISLAPTDPKLYYNKALILEQLKRSDEAIKSLKQALALKPNYDDALFKLAETYQKLGQIENSQKTYQQILKYLPGEPRATTKLQELATASAKQK